MTHKRFGRLVVLLCMGLAAACTSTDGGPAGNTELNLRVFSDRDVSGDSNAGTDFNTDRVDYKITCDASGAPVPSTDGLACTDDTNCPAGTACNVGSGQCEATGDTVDISGSFEVVDTGDPEGLGTPVFQTVMDLPPGVACTASLSVWDGDEIVCVGSVPFSVPEDGTQQVDIILLCTLSVDLPEGIADITGDFLFATGNLCPKFYVQNAIPQQIDISVVPAQTEIQYRTKDPDGSCGENCDPQTCVTGANPPDCSPSVFNPLAAECNPLAGGNPTDEACTGDGAAIPPAAGLVCQTVAVDAVGQNPAGTFFSPSTICTDDTDCAAFGATSVCLPTRDGLTRCAIGPGIVVNLSTASGIAGITLPGLGGPAGLQAPDGPASGSPAFDFITSQVPPLWYQCDPAFPGPVIINTLCGDGDKECNQTKILLLTCPGTNFCVDAVPAFDCLTPSDCEQNGVCVPTCDPACDMTAYCTAGTNAGGVCTVAADCPGGACVSAYDGITCCAAAASGDACPGDECVQCGDGGVIGDPETSGTVCDDRPDGSGGTASGVCDGNFNCVECLLDADCPDDNNECHIRPNCAQNCVGGLDDGDICTASSNCDDTTIGDGLGTCGALSCQPQTNAPPGTDCAGSCDDLTVCTADADCTAVPGSGLCNFAGVCDTGLCDVPATCGNPLNGIPETCFSPSVLADDCFLVTGSVPIPATPVVIPTTTWFDGDTPLFFPSAQAILPNGLLCFLDVAAAGGADLKDSAIVLQQQSAAGYVTRSYVDSTGGTDPESPHGLVRLDFSTLCPAGVDLAINFFPNNSTGFCNNTRTGIFQTGTCEDPGDASNPNIGASCISDPDCLTLEVLDTTQVDLGLGAAQIRVAGAVTAPVELFGFSHGDLSVDIGDVIPGTLDNVCIGGACPVLGKPVSVGSGFFRAATDGCAPVDRDGDGCPGAANCKPCLANVDGNLRCDGGSNASTAIVCTTDADCTGGTPSNNDSPRVMYDLNCGSAAFAAGDCTPFVDGQDSFLVDACDIADDTDALYGQACTTSADCGGAACTPQTMGSLFVTTDFAHLSDCCNGKADAPDPCASIRTASCSGIWQIYPTSSPAQWVPVPVNP